MHKLDNVSELLVHADISDIHIEMSFYLLSDQHCHQVMRSKLAGMVLAEGCFHHCLLLQ